MDRKGKKREVLTDDATMTEFNFYSWLSGNVMQVFEFRYICRSILTDCDWVNQLSRGYMQLG